MNNRAALDWVNFLLANVKDGLGPFLAVYLLVSQHWDAGRIGGVMMIAGLATVVARTPFGALLDWSHRKRGLIVIASTTVATGALVMSLFRPFLPVAIAQTSVGLADAVFPSAIAAVSLGIVGPKAFTQRVGRNEAFTHAGTASTALAAGVAGWLIPPGAVLWLVATLALASIWATLQIDAGAIDHALARGTDSEHEAQPTALRSLLGCRPLLMFVTAIFAIPLRQRGHAAAAWRETRTWQQGNRDPVYGGVHHYGPDRHGSDGGAGGSQGRPLGPQTHLSCGLRRAPASRRPLHVDPESIRSRFHPSPRWDRRWHLWGSVLDRHCGSDARNRTLQYCTGGRLGGLGPRRRSQQCRGWFHGRDHRTQHYISVPRYSRLNGFRALLHCRAGNRQGE
jgi:hypothetical protein